MLRNKMITKFFLALFSACVMGSAYGSSVIEPVYPNGKPSLPFTPGIKLSNGMLFVSGHIPYVNGGIPEYARDGKDDMADQAKIVMESLKTVLDKAGYTFDDAVKVTVFMTDINNYSAFNKVYATYWPGDKIPPAREAIEIGALPGGKPGAEVLVEVSLIAAK